VPTQHLPTSAASIVSVKQGVQWSGTALRGAGLEPALKQFLDEYGKLLSAFLEKALAD
jgi:hypothetical protein